MTRIEQAKVWVYARVIIVVASVSMAIFNRAPKKKGVDVGIAILIAVAVVGAVIVLMLKKRQ